MKTTLVARLRRFYYTSGELKLKQKIGFGRKHHQNLPPRLGSPDSMGHLRSFSRKMQQWMVDFYIYNWVSECVITVYTADQMKIYVYIAYIIYIYFYISYTFIMQILCMRVIPYSYVCAHNYSYLHRIYTDTSTQINLDRSSRKVVSSCEKCV